MTKLGSTTNSGFSQEYFAKKVPSFTKGGENTHKGAILCEVG
jgi:hypothetical protein